MLQTTTMFAKPNNARINPKTNFVKHGKKNEVLEYIDDAELTNEEQFDRGDKLYNLCMILEYIFINKQYSSDNIVETSPEHRFC